jgi:hypothetical protein
MSTDGRPRSRCSSRSRVAAAFIDNRCTAHRYLTHGGQTGAMITRRMKIRRHLRGTRTSALPEAERRWELREAEARLAHGHDRDTQVESPASPRVAGDGASSPREAAAERAGAGEDD